MTARKPNGFVIYQGPSSLDGAPIVVIAVKTKTGKANSKTGAMLQTYILRQDVDPLKANKSGKDYSICGACPLRGTPTKRRDRKTADGRRCYVFLAQGPLNVWRTWKRKRYPVLTGHAAIADLGKDAAVRIGTYGDGSAAPSYIWDSLLSAARMHTAYSHQSDLLQGSFRSDIYMQSADSLDQAQEAWAEGRRTFRVVNSVADIVKGVEILCPASKEAGKRTTCLDCGLCGGSNVKARSIAIPAHGSGAAHFAT